MVRERYYFSNCIEDDDLSELSVKAKEIVQQIDHIIKIFKINNEKLYGPPPRNALSFIQQNNELSFSPSSSNESSLRDAKSYEGMPTSSRCNPVVDAEKKEHHPAILKSSTPIGHQTPVFEPAIEIIPNTTINKTGTSNELFASQVSSQGSQKSSASAEIAMMITNLTLDDAEKKEHNSAILEFSTQIRHQNTIYQHANETRLNTTIDETGTSDEQFTSQVGSKGGQEASAFAEIAMKSTNLTIREKEFGRPAKAIGSNNASSLRSPRSIEISKIMESLMEAGKQLKSQVKQVGNFDASCQEIPASFESSVMNASLAMAEKDSRSPTKEVGKIKSEDQEPPRSSEIITTASSLTADDKESRNLIRNNQLTGHSSANKDFPDPEKNAGKSENSDSTYKVVKFEKVLDILIPSLMQGETSDSSYKVVKFEKVLDILVPSLMQGETHKRTEICSIPTFDIQECSNPSKKGKIAENSPEDAQVTVGPIAGAELNISPIETLKGIAREDRKRKSLSPARRKSTLFKSVPRVQVGNSPEDTQVTVSPIAGAELNTSPNEMIKEIARDDRKRKYLTPRRSTAFLKPVPRVLVENSPEDTQVTVSPIANAELNISPNEIIKEIARDDRKRKSLTPRKRSTAFIKSMPRVIKLAEDEIDIEIDLNYEAIPRAPRSKSANYRSDSTKDNVKSPADGKSKTDTSSKAPERYLRPSQRRSLIDSSCNISGTYNPVSDDEVYAGKIPTGNLSIEAPEAIDLSNRPIDLSNRPIDLSCKIEIRTADIEANPSLLNETIMKFNTLLAERDRFAKNSFVPFQNLQSSITFINSYVREVLHFILKLDDLGKCLTEELKDIVRDANAISDKFKNKLQSWEKDVDSVISTWHECFHQSEQLKAQYGPLFTDEGELPVTFKSVHVFEREMKTIWKKMYNMIMQVESMRALFSYSALDVERLTIMLVKCFILVGILKLC